MPAAAASASTEAEQLGRDLLDDTVKHVNNVSKLLALMGDGNEAACVEAMQTLRIYFVETLHSNVTSASAGKGGAASKLLAFVQARYKEYCDALLAQLQRDRSTRVQLAATVAVLEACRSEVMGTFSHRLFARLLDSMLQSRHVAPEVSGALVSKYGAFADVRFYLLKWIAARSAKLAASSASQNVVEAWHANAAAIVGTMFEVLCAMPATASAQLASWSGGLEAGVVAAAPVPKEGAKARKKRKLQDAQQGAIAAAGSRAEQSALWASTQAQQQAYSDAWLAFLRLPLPAHLFKRLLQALTDTVIPNVRSPVLLSDFLSQTVARGGLVGILALHGLFVLVTQHGFECPKFYDRLYSLLTPQVFTSRYRAKFLQLTDVFLASSLVPAYTVAAFVKRFARIAVTAPPMGAVVCTAFVHNLLRRHPSCTCMLHQPGADGAEGAGLDPYDDAAEDPAESRAVESSLWELGVLRHHVHPMVASFVQQLDRDLTDRKATAEIDMAPLLAEGYGTRLAEELDKKLRKAPPVAFYSAADAPRGILDKAPPGWVL